VLPDLQKHLRRHNSRSGVISRLYEKVSKAVEDTDKDQAAVTESNRMEPSTRFGLTGLAISGGGIRSATFAMGVLQGLANYDLLKFVDYMSTVSGGGYIVSFLSSVLNDGEHSARRETFPLNAQPGEEPPAVQHIRQNARYLDDGKTINVGVMPALALRGIL